MTMARDARGLAKKARSPSSRRRVQTEMIRSDDGGKTWHGPKAALSAGNSYYYFGNVYRQS